MQDSDTDTVYRRAKARKDQILQELSEINSFLVVYERFSVLDSESTGDNGLIGRVAGHRPQSPNSTEFIESNRDSIHGVWHESAAPRRTKIPRGMTQMDTEREVREILISNGRPMSALELVQQIRDRGRAVGGANEVSNLKTKLWRAKDRVRLFSGSGYWPTDIDCAAIGYVAPQRE